MNASMGRAFSMEITAASIEEDEGENVETEPLVKTAPKAAHLNTKIPQLKSLKLAHENPNHIEAQRLIKQGKQMNPEDLTFEFLEEASHVLAKCQNRTSFKGVIPLLKLVERAPTKSYAALGECIRIYEGLGYSRTAIVLTERLLDRGFFLPNTILRSSLLACMQINDIERGFHIYERSLEKGTIPNMSVFTVLLTLCARLGNSEKVEFVVDKMHRSGLSMTIHSYNSLMNAYFKSGYIEKGLEVYTKMKERRIAADKHTYSILIDMYCDTSNYETAYSLMNELRTTKELNPNLVNYNLMLKVCGKSSNLSKAFEIYEEMKKKKITPDLVTIITMMHAIYHGKTKNIDPTLAKFGVGIFGAGAMATLPFLDFANKALTYSFCGTLVGSMLLGVYLNPNGVIKSLYPNSDDPRTDSKFDAFFRRLAEEDQAGRTVYMWREMTRFGIRPDSSLYDIFVRTCVKKRHPNMVFEGIFNSTYPAIKDGQFVLNIPTTVQLLHSTIAQGRMNVAKEIYDTALKGKCFSSIFREKGDSYRYDLREFNTKEVASFAIIQVVDSLKQAFASGKKSRVPDLQIMVNAAYEALDQLDFDNSKVRNLFSMDEMEDIDSACSNIYVRSSKLESYISEPEIPDSFESR